MGYDLYTDDDLLGAFKEGDELAFTEIYDRNYDDLLIYFFRWLNDKQMAEELIQDLFTKLWRIHGELKIKKGLTAYISGMAHNMVINKRDRIFFQTKEKKMAIKHIANFRSEQLADPRELERYDNLLEEALNSLPPQRRQVFVLIRHGHRTYEAAAKEMNISVNTVKDHQKRAVKALKRFVVEKAEIPWRG